MTVREAIERGPIDRARTIGTVYSETQFPDPMLVEYSRRTLQNSKALEGVNELAQIIREKDSGVEVEERVHPDGSVSVEIRWNRRPFEGKNVPPHYYYNAISVSADPFNDELMISSKEESEFIPQPMWSSNPTEGPSIVEYAIAHAYRNPIEKIGPPPKM